MSDWPIGLSTGCFYRTSIFDCLESLRQGGFSMIEVCSFPAHLDYHDVEQVKRAGALINELGMEPYSFHAPFADHIDISALDHGRREAALAEILRAVEAASILGVRYFVIHPGPEHSFNPPIEEYFHRLQYASQVLNRVAFRCHEKGMRCVLENKLPHLLFGNTRDLLWILGSLDTTEVGICLDTGHAFLAGGIYNVIHKLSGHLQMIHANDNHGHGDDHKPPGEGSIDWPRILRELARSHFRGGFILEVSGEGDPAQVLESARRGRRFLRETARTVAA